LTKNKTLNQIAPVWAKRIKANEVGKHVSELGDFSRCIVGEAWRYSDEYLEFCNECQIRAFGLTNFKNKESFNYGIRLFEQHFNKEHLP
jgi:hypothetical protein